MRSSHMPFRVSRCSSEVVRLEENWRLWSRSGSVQNLAFGCFSQLVVCFLAVLFGLRFGRLPFRQSRTGGLVKSFKRTSLPKPDVHFHECWREGIQNCSPCGVPVVFLLASARSRANRSEGEAGDLTQFQGHFEASPCVLPVVGSWTST